MPDLPNFKDWPDNAGDSLPVDQIVRMYGEGFIGARDNPEAQEELIYDAEYKSIDHASHDNKWAGSGKGKLITPFTYIMAAYPTALPGPAQERGDCVSHSEKNACLMAVVCDVVDAKPDEVTGKVEGYPGVSPEGMSNGVLSTEWLYWFRGYNGDGWDCPTAARVAKKHGIMLRHSYPELGIDLTSYSGRLAGKYGRQSPPDSFDQVGRQHLIHDVTSLDSAEELRDALANGFGVSSCGGEGFSSNRDGNGVSRRQGSWSHAMAVIGFDDRPVAHDKYGGPLALIQNSWGQFNTGSRRIMGTNIDIPHGSFWARWRDVRRRNFLAHSGAAGWGPKRFVWTDLSEIIG